MGKLQKELWTPSEEVKNNSNIQQFIQWLASRKNLYFSDYNALWAWSIAQVEDFWMMIWEYFDIINHGNLTTVLQDEGMPNVSWFNGAKVNYAEHVFRNKTTERPALFFKNEQISYFYSWAKLEKEVASIQKYLIAIGVQKGDRVAAYLPNIPEAIISFLAVNSIGAIWSCCSPDFGDTTVIERFKQIKPRLLICADGYRYNNKAFNRISSVQSIIEQIESIERCLLISYLDKTSYLEKADQWSNVIHTFSSDQLSFTPVEFNMPIWILYSSGTTGIPKAITHSAGGVLLEHYKYLSLHNNIKKGEFFFWYTTTGWMMWNFLQASMLVGGIPVVYDGSASYPSMNVLWQLAADLPLHHFGTSAPYLTACMKQKLAPGRLYDLSNLQSIGSTGAPLPPESFDWVYTEVGKHIWLASMSGGTDVCTAFVGGNPLLPVYKGYIQCRALGCALFAYNEYGQSIEGELGEMVIEQPMPSMPIYFWNDPIKKRYIGSYFEVYPNKWCHGDWIQLESNGSLIIQGRSDATLNRKGIRIGTAEIYNILEEFREIVDSLIINIELKNGDDKMPLFVVLREGYLLDESLKSRINLALRSKGSPRHVPDYIRSVPDLPYTMSGKKMEIPIKKIFMDRDISLDLNKDAVRNPEALQYFIDNISELRGANY